MIKVYVKLNEQNEIVQINSNIFIVDTTDWIMIDEGEGDKFAHAQGNYFNKPITDEHGRYNYKLIDGIIVEVTEKEEIAIEKQITTEERLEALESAMLEIILGGME